MRRKSNVLFIQLPQLDNDVHGPHENVPLAAAYLTHALERSEERRLYTAQTLGPPDEDGDDGALVASILAREPAVVAATLYLWNVERTLRVLRLVKQRLPSVRIAVGGPEVAAEHPFLFRSGVVDAAVAGEGEGVLPLLLRALRTGRDPNAHGIAWRSGAGFRWGRRPAPAMALCDALPPPAYGLLEPDPAGMAYTEASRGCPLACTYCRYHHLRARPTYLEPADVIARVAALRRRGAREIRFVDPTFNAHPRFREIVRWLARLNRTGGLRFFAELRGDVLTPDDADWLAAARFAEIEIGVQTIAPRVLELIRRPTRLESLECGITALLARGIAVTVDLMYGLPGQTFDGFSRSLDWAHGLERRGQKLNVQCLQTLLIPGTDLRRLRRRWSIRSLPKPPYGVLSTNTFSEREMHRAEELLQQRTPAQQDCVTVRFVGRHLPDLFPERIHIHLPADPLPGRIPGFSARRAVLLHGDDLWAARAELLSILCAAVRREPGILWQFVLVPGREEPLDLLDLLIAGLRGFPAHLNDRYAAVRFARKMAARRLFVQLRRDRTYDLSWTAAAERMLRAAFW